jgi:GntR family transcriptional repressor for pyruvate dehydrogenase complex
MKFQEIKAERLYIKVAKQLSQLVRTGALQAGHRLPSERDLAEKLNVSRPTIREAMIALEMSGIVEIRTGSGIFVTDKKPLLTISDKGIGPFEIYDFRLIIEPEACARAVKNITDEQIAELKITLLEMKNSANISGEADDFDFRFHNIIAEATQNVAISTVINWIWEVRHNSAISNSFAQKLRLEGLAPSIQEHSKIITALESRDEDKARAAMKEHIETARASAVETYFGNKETS